MKNIHTLPTDKPSRLYEFGGEYHLQIKSQENFRSQNIYITNDEEIKDGDWLLIIDDFETYVHKHKGDNLPTTYYKKIILTTDAELIKDGVQSIDDEFLKWFVKNPSCESVEVFKDFFQVNQNNPTIKIPQNASEMMLTTNDDIIQSIPPDDEFSEWDVTLMDGLENEPPYNLTDDWDNINGDLV
jgi:hypothetical protein